MLSMVGVIVAITVGSFIVALPLGLACAVGIVMALPDRFQRIVQNISRSFSRIPTILIGIGTLIIVPHMESNNTQVSTVIVFVVALPMFIVGVIIFCDLLTAKARWEIRRIIRPVITAVIMIVGIIALITLSREIRDMTFPALGNALLLSLILGFMAIPTVIHISADSLTSAVRRFRMASYALGATRSETLAHIIIPAARMGILTSLLLGTTRAITEMMAVHMSDMISSFQKWAPGIDTHLELILGSVMRMVHMISGRSTVEFGYPDIPALIIIASTTLLGDMAAQHIMNHTARRMDGYNVAA